MLDGMQAELVAQRQILALLTYGVAGASGIDINEMADRLHAMAQDGEHAPVNERVEWFAKWIVGPERPQFTVIEGGKSD